MKRDPQGQSKGGSAGEPEKNSRAANEISRLCVRTAQEKRMERRLTKNYALLAVVGKRV